MLLPRFDSQTQNDDQSDIKILERFYDRSGKKCRPMINTNITNFDLRYIYGVIGDTLESYVRYRKLNRCKALSNFIEYRNKVYKREKIEEKQLKIISSNISQSPETPKSTIIPTPSKIIKSPPITKPALIPIPSPELLRSPVPKQKTPSTPKKTTINPKQIKLKTSPSSNIKRKS